MKSSKVPLFTSSESSDFLRRPNKSNFCDLLRKSELYWSGTFLNYIDFFGSMWTSLEIANTAG
jgi:hypothetical protein